jgi:hypothetical protein
MRIAITHPKIPSAMLAEMQLAKHAGKICFENLEPNDEISAAFRQSSCFNLQLASFECAFQPVAALLG